MLMLTDGWAQQPVQKLWWWQSLRGSHVHGDAWACCLFLAESDPHACWCDIRPWSDVFFDCLGEVESGDFSPDPGGGKNQNGGDRVDGSSSAAAADESEILCSRCFTPPARHQDHDASWEIVTASLTPLAARPLSPRRRFVTTHLDAGLRLTCVIMTAH